MTVRNLILSGGIHHPFDETSAKVAAILGALGVRSEIAGVGEGFARLAREAYDMVTVNALAWSMNVPERYVPQRDAHGFEPSAADRRAFADHLRRGGGVLGLHTAAICFDTWPQWPSILGAAWNWAASHHPPPGVVSVRHGEDSFDIEDELYCDLTLSADAAVLASGRAQGSDVFYPVLTVRPQAAYLALGHDMRALRHPGYARLLHVAATHALNRHQGAA